MKLLLVLLSLVLVSCGESPLFNHEMEKAFELRRDAVSDLDENKFSKTGYSFSVDWTEPPRVGEAKFNLKFWKSGSGSFNGPYVDPKESLHVFLWMPSMGHGSAPVKIAKTATGEYEVSNVFFIMAGKWEVKFQLLSNGKVVDETVLSVSL